MPQNEHFRVCILCTSSGSNWPVSIFDYIVLLATDDATSSQPLELSDWLVKLEGWPECFRYVCARPDGSSLKLWSFNQSCLPVWLTHCQYVYICIYTLKPYIIHFCDIQCDRDWAILKQVIHFSNSIFVMKRKRMFNREADTWPNVVLLMPAKGAISWLYIVWRWWAGCSTGRLCYERHWLVCAWQAVALILQSYL